MDDTAMTDQVRGSRRGDDADVDADDGPARVGYRFPPRNPHTGAVVGLLRAQFPVTESR